MALVESRWRDEEMRRSFWDDDRWMRDWDDWPIDWPQPRELVRRFRSAFDRRRSFLDWPSDWPTMDAVVPRVRLTRLLKSSDTYSAHIP
uniref:SHSP domain-containing protein n=1 Tax=Parascaris univalens TaxID=6257 RepID=A0A914ZTR4_PARUN